MHCIGLRMCILDSTRIPKGKLASFLLCAVVHQCNALVLYMLHSHIELLVSKIGKRLGYNSKVLDVGCYSQGM